MNVIDLREALKTGKTVVGTMVREVRSPAIAQILAIAGFDFIFIDLEHSSYNFETAADIIRQARSSNLCVIVRVPEIEKHWVSRILDAGADGIMAPYVETAAEAREIVRYAKYPPLGRRGLSTQIGHTDYVACEGTEVIRAKNAETLVIPQIETPLGVSNAGEIASVEGVDGLMLGPNDLSLSMGKPGQVMDPAVVEKIEQVSRAALEKGHWCGVHAGNWPLVQKCAAMGMRVLAYSTDIGFLASAGKAAADQLRRGGGPQ